MMFLEIVCLAIALENVGKNVKVVAEQVSASKGFESAVTSWFPRDTEFNESCVTEGCPALTNFSLCPNDINITVLHAVLNTAVGCMRKTMCGILIDLRPTPMTTFTTDELLPGMDLDGNLTTLPDTNFLSNLSNIEFELLPNNHQSKRPSKEITMFIPNIRCYGSLRLDLTLRQILPLNIGPALSVTIPEVKYNVGYEYVSVMSIRHSINDSSFEIKLLNPISKMETGFCGLDMPDGFPNIIALITSMGQDIVERSSWAIRTTDFLEKYFQIAFRIVSKSC